MQVWNITCGRDGYSLRTTDTKIWALVLERGFERLCDLSGGRLGGHQLGPWAWRVPLGRPDWDRSVPDEPWLCNSLAGGLMDLENWTYTVAWKHGTKEYPSIPLTHEQALAIDPTFTAEMDDVMKEDDDA